MNYYNEIKNELINNEVYGKVKDYSKNRHDLETRYNVGKLLYEAGKHYGEGIIKNYSIKLTNELGKGYTTTNLKYMRQFYLYVQKGHPMGDELNWTHYRILLSLKDDNEIKFYTNQCIKFKLSKRELISRIKSKEYERLDDNTKLKLINNEDTTLPDIIKEPIIINNHNHIEVNKEKALQLLIMEDLFNFLKELGEGFTYVGNEYPIKIGNNYHYIDILLFNIIYNCYVVIELKMNKLNSKYIGQILEYVNYIDKNIKSPFHNKTIGIILVKQNNALIMEYCSDDRILSKEYIIN